MTIKKVLLLFSTAATAVICAAAGAEPAATPDAAAAPSDVNSIPEIVVTAEKRTESLERVPDAISAYTSKERDLIGIETIQDMTNFTPGLAYSTVLDRAYIRGVGRDTNNLATQPGVATYKDGVYNSSVVAASGDSLFEDRIEVLRGPQGTLYGRNAIGGTIDSISRRPTPDWYAEVRADVGNYGVHNFEGALSGPITDTMRFRFAGYRNTQEDGYFNNVADGKTEGGSGNFFYWEAQFEWDITPDVEFWLLVDQLGYNDSYRAANFTGSYDYAPYPVSSLSPGAAFGYTIPGYTAVGPATQNPGIGNIRNFSANDPSNAHLSRTYEVTPQLTWHTPWNADLKYIGGYTTYYYSLYQDNDYSSLTSYAFPVNAGSTGCGVQCPPLIVYPSSVSHYVENKKYYSNEFNLTSHSDSPLQWIVGIYQYHEQFSQPVTVALTDQATMPQYNGSPCPAGVGCIATPLNLAASAPAAPNPSDNIYAVNADMHANSFATFAQTDWKFLPTWKNTTGVRFTYDELAGTEYARELYQTPPNVYGAYAPVIDLTSFLINTNPFAGVTNLPALNPATGFYSRGLAAHWDAVTGTEGFEWTPTDTVLGYFKYSRGYKSGGFNAGYGGAISASPQSQPEHIDALELGGKVAFNRQLQVNGAIYGYNYKQLQIPLTVQPALGPAYTSIVNLPKVISYGAELETVWQPIANLQFLINYAYMDATIRSNYHVTNPVTGSVVDVIGQTVPQSPRNKVAVNGNYTWHFTPGALNFSASYIWKDKTYDGIFNDSYYLAPAYSQIDSRLTWNDAADRYTVFLYIKNLQNKLGYDNVSGGAIIAPAPGYPKYDTTYGLTPPRTYGVQIQYRLK